MRLLLALLALAPSRGVVRIAPLRHNLAPALPGARRRLATPQCFAGAAPPARRPPARAAGAGARSRRAGDCAMIVDQRLLAAVVGGTFAGGLHAVTGPDHLAVRARADAPPRFARRR